MLRIGKGFRPSSGSYSNTWFSGTYAALTEGWLYSSWSDAGASAAPGIVSNVPVGQLSRITRIHVYHRGSNGYNGFPPGVGDMNLYLYTTAGVELVIHTTTLAPATAAYFQVVDIDVSAYPDRLMGVGFRNMGATDAAARRPTVTVVGVY